MNKYINLYIYKYLDLKNTIKKPFFLSYSKNKNSYFNIIEKKKKVLLALKNSLIKLKNLIVEIVLILGNYKEYFEEQKEQKEYFGYKINKLISSKNNKYNINKYNIIKYVRDLIKRKKMYELFRRNERERKIEQFRGNEREKLKKLYEPQLNSDIAKIKEEKKKKLLELPKLLENYKNKQTTKLKEIQIKIDHYNTVIPEIKAKIDPYTPPEERKKKLYLDNKRIQNLVKKRKILEKVQTTLKKEIFPKQLKEYEKKIKNLAEELENNIPKKIKKYDNIIESEIDKNIKKYSDEKYIKELKITLLFYKFDYKYLKLKYKIQNFILEKMKAQIFRIFKFKFRIRSRFNIRNRFNRNRKIILKNLKKKKQILQSKSEERNVSYISIQNIQKRFFSQYNISSLNLYENNNKVKKNKNKFNLKKFKFKKKFKKKIKTNLIKQLKIFDRKKIKKLYESQLYETQLKIKEKKKELRSICSMPKNKTLKLSYRNNIYSNNIFKKRLIQIYKIRPYFIKNKINNLIDFWTVYKTKNFFKKILYKSPKDFINKLNILAFKNLPFRNILIKKVQKFYRFANILIKLSKTRKKKIKLIKRLIGNKNQLKYLFIADLYKQIGNIKIFKNRILLIKKKRELYKENSLKGFARVLGKPLSFIKEKKKELVKKMYKKNKFELAFEAKETRYLFRSVIEDFLESKNIEINKELAILYSKPMIKNDLIKRKEKIFLPDLFKKKRQIPLPLLRRKKI